MRNIHLIVSDLLLPKEYWQDLALPTLHKILARSQYSSAESMSYENLLTDALNAPKETALAPLLATAEGLPSTPDSHWLCAQPSHLRLQRDQLLLAPCSNITLDEASQICTTLNQHFAEESLVFFAAHPQRWYLQHHRNGEMETHSFSSVIGKNIQPWLPKGPDAMYWHKLGNEIQMLLFNHPVNQQREEQGMPTINSLWLWGNGLATQPSPPTSLSIQSDDTLAQLLAKASTIPYTEWVNIDWSPSSSTTQLLIYRGLHHALQNGDIQFWQENLQQLEKNYLAPMYQAIRCGKITALRLDILDSCKKHQYTLNRWNSYAFWRTKKSS